MSTRPIRRRRSPARTPTCPGWRAGGVGAQFWSVFVPAELQGEAAVTATLEQIDLVHELIRRYPDALGARADRRRRRADHGGGPGRVADRRRGRALDRLLAGHAAGAVRARGPVHDPHPQPQPALGRRGDRRARGRRADRLRARGGAARCSGSACSPTCPTSPPPPCGTRWTSPRRRSSSPTRRPWPSATTRRNVPDDVLARLPGNGGVCMVTFVPSFVSQRTGTGSGSSPRRCARRGLDPAYVGARGHLRAEREHVDDRSPAARGRLAEVADHVEHVREVAGVDHVGMGGDYDGIESAARGAGGRVVLPGAVRRAAAAAAGARRTAASWPAATSCGPSAAPRRRRSDISARRGPSRARIEDTAGRTGPEPRGQLKWVAGRSCRSPSR